MSATAFTDPADNFSDGLAVLRAYHQRMLAHCVELQLLADKAEQDALSGRDMESARRMAGFFAVATGLHHRDEEQVLFPLLVHASAMMAAMIDRLDQDHDELEHVWEILAPLLGEPDSIPGDPEFPAIARRFARLLQWHIEREEDNFLPRAQTLMTSAQRRESGRRMLRLRQPEVAGAASVQ